MAIGFLALLLLATLGVGLIAGLVVLFVRSGPAGRWLMGGIIGVPLLVLLMRLGRISMPAPMELLIVIAVGAVAGLMAASRRSGHGARWPVGVIAAVLLLGGGLFALAGLFAVRSVAVLESVVASRHVNDFNLAVTRGHAPLRPAELATSRPAVVLESDGARIEADGLVVEMPAPAGLASDSAGWQSAVELGFDADVYPSMRAAAEAMAHQAADMLPRAVQAGEKPRLLEIYGDGNIDAGVLQAVSGALVREYESMKVMVQSTLPRDPGLGSGVLPDAIIVEIDWPHQVTHHQAPWDRGRQERSGELSMKVRGQLNVFRFTRQFVEKPWVEGFAEFASARPRTRWVVGASPQLEPNQADAEAAAIRSAANQLLPYVVDEVTRRGGSLAPPVGGPSGGDWLQSRIAAELRSGSFTTDRFVQSFNKPYGQVWREAVLVDASPGQISGLAGACVGVARVYRAAWMQKVVSIAGLLVLICVVYLFLNFATKGYYAWSLRIAVGVAIVAGVLVVLNLA